MKTQVKTPNHPGQTQHRTAFPSLVLRAQTCEKFFLNAMCQCAKLPSVIAQRGCVYFSVYSSWDLATLHTAGAI